MSLEPSERLVVFRRTHTNTLPNCAFFRSAEGRLWVKPRRDGKAYSGEENSTSAFVSFVEVRHRLRRGHLKLQRDFLLVQMIAPAVDHLNLFSLVIHFN